MTEQEWLTSTELMPMVDFLGEKLDARKLRLFACASARRVWKLLDDDQSKLAVEVGERFADGLASAADLALAFRTADATWASMSDYAGSRRAMRRSEKGRAAAKKAAWLARNAANPDLSRRQLGYYSGRTARTNFAHASVLRDLFGPLPFRAVEVAPAWLAWNAGAVPGLAETIDEDGTFDLMPVLGDALEDAGCEDAAILDHLRGEGGHVRGCWALDLILGRRSPHEPRTE
jgi:hypothetical protein